MASTKAEIRNRVGEDLDLIQLGQSLVYKDQVRIEKAYDEVYAQLKKKGLATWATSDGVPDELTPHVAALMADNCLNTYSVPNDRYVRIKNAVSEALPQIRELITPDHDDQTSAVDF